MPARLTPDASCLRDSCPRKRFQHLDFGRSVRAQRGVVAVDRCPLRVRRIVTERAREIYREEGQGGNPGAGGGIERENRE